MRRNFKALPMKKICVIGHLCFGLNLLNGQTGRIKDGHVGLRRINSLTNGAVRSASLSNTSCKSSAKSCLKRVILEAFGTFVKPQNSQIGFE